jgi:uncharacterized RDD family membrane protein YckC
MLLVKLDTGFNIEVDFTVIPFHKRFIAWAIDLIILFVYFKAGAWLIGEIFGSLWNQQKWAVILFGLPGLLYHPACEIFMNGQSFGKKILRARVIAADGGQPTLSQYLIRSMFRLADMPLWILYFIEYDYLPWWCAIFLFSGLACVLFSSHLQRIGDLVAGTILIDTRALTSWEDTVFTELEDNYRPRFPEVMRLSDKDINTLKSIIGTVKKRSDYDLSMRICERIKSKLDIRSDQDSLDFLETLLKDYNYYSTN